MPINATGIPSNLATPGDFFEINFGVGPGNIGQGTAILLIANKTTAGSATADTVVYGPSSTPPLQTENDMIALGGAGSEAHRLWRRIRRVNRNTPVYCIFPSESGGAQATGTLTLANASTGAATLRIGVGDETVDVAIGSSDSVNTIGANAAQAVNNQTQWPVTCGYLTNVLTFTAKQHGPRGNEIRIRGAIVNGTTATTVSPNATSTALSGGTTEDAWTTALSTILPTRYYYIVSPSTIVGSSNFDALVTQVLSQALPATGIRQRVLAGFVGSQSSGSTIAANSLINTPRATMVWLQTPELTAGELAAQYAAVLSQFEDLSWAYNFRDFGKGTIGDVDTTVFWKVPAPLTQANWPTGTGIETALNNGLTPIGVTQNGFTYITWATTTKHKNGSNFDYRVRSSHIVSVLDRWVDELQLEYAARFGAKQVADDPKQGERLPASSVVTPRQVKALIFEKIDKYANRYFKQADVIKAGVEVLRDTDNLSRIGARIPARVIDLLLQNIVEVDDNSTAQ